MKTVLTIMKKEFARIFKDKRLVLSLILPGVLLYCIYSLLGGVIGDMVSPTKIRRTKSPSSIFPPLSKPTSAPSPP